ncbi:multicilin [Trichomycterus rosablanca]|uniref:multicilin n=1 Tax=Trichomycterus rosablanca TaxID=2290929 RepID=UPI002F35D4B1
MMDVVDPVQCYLNNTIQINRQLHESLQRKQEEISALKERNSQLMELLKQADHYAALLDELQLQPEECASHPAVAPVPHPHSPSAEPAEWHPSSPQPSWLESLLLDTPPEKEQEEPYTPGSEQRASTRVRRQLWPSHHDSSSDECSFTESLGWCPTKRPKLDQDLDFPQRLHSETVCVFGSFHGLQVLKPTTPSTSHFCMEDTACFKTSIREHSTVQTRAYPHGKTLTSLTPDGSCKFLWVPKHN